MEAAMQEFTSSIDARQKWRVDVTTGPPFPGRYHVATRKFVFGLTTVTDKTTKLISADNPGTF